MPTVTPIVSERGCLQCSCHTCSTYCSALCSYATAQTHFLSISINQTFPATWRTQANWSMLGTAHRCPAMQLQLHHRQPLHTWSLAFLEVRPCRLTSSLGSCQGCLRTQGGLSVPELSDLLECQPLIFQQKGWSNCLLSQQSFSADQNSDQLRRFIPKPPMDPPTFQMQNWDTVIYLRKSGKEPVLKAVREKKDHYLIYKIHWITCCHGYRVVLMPPIRTCMVFFSLLWTCY